MKILGRALVLSACVCGYLYAADFEINDVPNKKELFLSKLGEAGTTIVLNTNIEGITFTGGDVRYNTYIDVAANIRGNGHTIEIAGSKGLSVTNDLTIDNLNMSLAPLDNSPKIYTNNNTLTLNNVRTENTHAGNVNHVPDIVVGSENGQTGGDKKPTLVISGSTDNTRFNNITTNATSSSISIDSTADVLSVNLGSGTNDLTVTGGSKFRTRLISSNSDSNSITFNNYNNTSDTALKGTVKNLTFIGSTLTLNYPITVTNELNVGENSTVNLKEDNQENDEVKLTANILKGSGTLNFDVDTEADIANADDAGALKIQATPSVNNKPVINIKNSPITPTENPTPLSTLVQPASTPAAPPATGAQVTPPVSTPPAPSQPGGSATGSQPTGGSTPSNINPTGTENSDQNNETGTPGGNTIGDNTTDGNGTSGTEAGSGVGSGSSTPDASGSVSGSNQGTGGDNPQNSASGGSQSDGASTGGGTQQPPVPPQPSIPPQPQPQALPINPVIENLFEGEQKDIAKAINSKENLSPQMAEFVRQADATQAKELISSIQKSTKEFGNMLKGGIDNHGLRVHSELGVGIRLAKLSNTFTQDLALASAIKALSEYKFAAGDNEAIYSIVNEYTKLAPNSIWGNLVAIKAQLGDYKPTYYGFSLGYDKRIDDSLVGGYIGYTKGKIKETKSDNYQFGLYSRKYFDSSELDLKLDMTRSNFKTKSTIATRAVVANQKANFKYNSIGLGFDYGFINGLSQNAFIKPFFGLAYEYTNIGKISQDGDIKINFGSSKIHTLNAKLGVEYRQYFSESRYIFATPYAQSQILKSSKIGKASFANGTAINLDYKNKRNNYIGINTGANVSLTRELGMELNLGLKVGKDEKYANGTLGLNYKF